MSTPTNSMARVKERTWFYEFDLPDGTHTRSDIPPSVLPIHTSRRGKLRQIIADRIPDASNLTALDLASHEGYYTLELAKHFKSVLGLEIRHESLEAARLITHALEIGNVEFRQIDLQKAEFDVSLSADFVLCYGLLYHLEDPIHTIRLASQLTRRHILIETQVYPHEVSGLLEDGHYLWQRPIEGVFALTVDYSQGREGGSTDIALVPSVNALLSLLRTFGFKEIQMLPRQQGDYEQFARGSRVIVYGSK